MSEGPRLLPIEQPVITTKSGYDYKVFEELGWGILIALVLTVGQALATVEDTMFSDPWPWVISLAGASARSVGVVIVNWVRQIMPALVKLLAGGE